jgi:hypothetical protein
MQKNLKISDSLHKRLKMLATFHEIQLSDLADTAISYALDRADDMLSKLLDAKREHAEGNKKPEQ